jgi:hypothetical protein
MESSGQTDCLLADSLSTSTTADRKANIMSLNWEATNIPDYEELKTDAEWEKTNTLIWVTLVLQYGWELTDKNLDMAWERLYAFQKVTNREYLTYADLKRRVGLSTNSGTMTDAQWKKHLMTIIAREAKSAQA